MALPKIACALWDSRSQGHACTSVWQSHCMFQLCTQGDTAQHSTAQHSTAQHGTAQHGTSRHSAAQHNTAQHGTAQHSMVQYNTSQHSATPPATTGSSSPATSLIRPSVAAAAAPGSVSTATVATMWTGVLVSSSSGSKPSCVSSWGRWCTYTAPSSRNMRLTSDCRALWPDHRSVPGNLSLNSTLQQPST